MTFWSEFCYLNVVGAVSKRRSYFLYVAPSIGFDDLYLYFQVGWEIDLVFIPDHFIKPEGVAAVVLPGNSETYCSF